jgi:hypothetical protein
MWVKHSLSYEGKHIQPETKATKAGIKTWQREQSNESTNVLSTIPTHH